MTIELKRANDDGLPIPDVGGWAVDKYRMVALYAELFSTGMKNKWDQRVFLDLYAASGFARLRGTQTILMGSPLIALTVPDPFDRYIFCEKDPELLRALRKRSALVGQGIEPVFIEGDCNAHINEILAAIPKASTSNRVLTLCFVDPFNLEGVKFETLRELSTRYIDFLCLLALHMDANRNYERYVSEDASQVDDFLGYREWRSKWREAQWQPTSFPDFLAREFSERMQTLNYLPNPLYRMVKMRSDEKNLPLYHLALFSRSNTAYKYWDDVMKYSTDQRLLF